MGEPLTTEEIDYLVAGATVCVDDVRPGLGLCEKCALTLRWAATVKALKREVERLKAELEETLCCEQSLGIAVGLGDKIIAERQETDPSYDPEEELYGHYESRD